MVYTAHFDYNASIRSAALRSVTDVMQSDLTQPNVQDKSTIYQ